MSAPLAIYTESPSPVALKTPSDGSEKRLLRWELQRSARQLLGTQHRIGVCHRVQVQDLDGNGVRVFQCKDSEATYYRGLMICANIWACPVCSAKISERRREELERAISSVTASGGGVYHMLLTIPHTRKDKPLGLVADLLKAYERLCSGKYRLSALVPGYLGFVRALEVTHGENGWHPHLHVLVFTETALSPSQVDLMRHVLWAKWEARVLKITGKSPSRQAFSFDPAVHGSFEQTNFVTVESEAVHVCPVTGYVTKFGTDREIEEIVQRRRWGAADELTRANAKKSGRAGGRSPWQLLADFQEGDIHAGMLWKEFITAFKGRAQLYWSQGLRSNLGLDNESTDEQLAAAIDAQDRLLARISDPDWKLILARNLRGQVLEVLRTGTWADVRLLLEKAEETDEERPATRTPTRTPTATTAPSYSQVGLFSVLPLAASGVGDTGWKGPLGGSRYPPNPD